MADVFCFVKSLESRVDFDSLPSDAYVYLIPDEEFPFETTYCYVVDDESYYRSRMTIHELAQMKGWAKL